ncbi:proline-rich protein 23A-like [Talpa occidentalis]|uniref:proline-rich protein 23A-like n=1 Tax=Talpa occidentalis TaxID=50954 RepID=UPI00188DF4EB|nr:proline-rich protein 23A-like [Talpa occidentalis]
MGTRPRSPSAYPAPCWGPQPGEPRPAKRPRHLESQGPNFQMPPNLADLTEPQAAEMVTMAILPAGCALKVPLDDVDLVLEPEPTSVLQVRLRGHTLVLVPEALLRLEDLHLGGQGHLPAGLEPSPFLGAEGEAVILQQSFFRTSSREMAAQGVVHQDAGHQLPPPWMDHAAGSDAGLRPVAPQVASPHLQGPVPEPWPWAPTPSPERRSPGPYFSLRLRLLEPFPNSPLQPLPPTPNPGPQARPQRPRRPQHLHPKARRRLFLN